MWKIFNFLKNKNKREVTPVEKLGTGTFKIIQRGHYISLVIRDTEVVAQKYVVDDSIYNELFDYIIYKFGGRIPFSNERELYLSEKGE